LTTKKHPFLHPTYGVDVLFKEGHLHAVSCEGAQGVGGEADVHMADTAHPRQHDLKQVLIPRRAARENQA